MNLDDFEESGLSNRNVPVLSTDDWKLRFENAGLVHRWDKFKLFLKDEVTLIPTETDESEINIGQSKIGGRPDLPKNQSWFTEDNGKSLSFLAQINLSETMEFDRSNQLPRNGLLYFFYSAEQEAWGVDPRDKDKFKVLYFDGDIADTKRADYPSDLHEFSRYRACKIDFASSVSAPSPDSGVVDELFFGEEQDAYIDLAVDGEITKLLGHPDNIQGPMEVDCQLIINGLYYRDISGYMDPGSEKLKKEVNNWMLLFQIDSVDKAGMMWGDLGRIYFWIKKDDLAKKDFEKVWFMLQCA